MHPACGHDAPGRAHNNHSGAQPWPSTKRLSQRPCSWLAPPPASSSLAASHCASAEALAGNVQAMATKLERGGRFGTSRTTARRAMAVHADPDDEASTTGGILAKYSAEGLRTVLVTCTNGQRDSPNGGKPGDDGHDENCRRRPPPPGKRSRRAAGSWA